MLFLPCAAGVETHLAEEIRRIVPHVRDMQTSRAGVLLRGAWRDALSLNLHSRLAQRVLVRLAYAPYRDEEDLYEIGCDVSWEAWFTPRHTLKVEVTAQHSPLKSLNFAALRIKDAVCDRLRHKTGERPSVDTQRPDVRLFLHLTRDAASVYIDTSGEPLFKRGWREDKGDAPLKETLAAAMIAATGWQADVPLYDPCCGSGTVLIEAAQIALNMAPGRQRRFGFERLLPYQSHVWQAMRQQALAQEKRPGDAPLVFGSDISFRMVDFAKRNAERADVLQAIELRGGDALQRMPPSAQAGVLLLNPPYGERIAAAGAHGQNAASRAHTREARGPRVFGPASGASAPSAPSGLGRESARSEDGNENADFFAQLASHWKRHYSGWQAWLLTPDSGLPSQMRFKPSRRVPMWNGPIECRLFCFDLIEGSARKASPDATALGD